MRYRNRISEALRAVVEAFSLSSDSLADIVEVFVSMQISPGTQRAYRTDITQALAALGLSNTSFSALKRRTFADLHAHLTVFLSSGIKRNAHGHILNGNTISRKRYTLVKFFQFLMDVHGFPFNPAASLRRFPRSQHSTSPILEESELWEFFRKLKRRRRRDRRHFRDFLIVLGLFHFALRRHELVGLRWNDIHQVPVPHFRVWQKRNRLKFLPIPAKYLQYLDEYEHRYGRSSEFLFHPLTNNRTGTLDRPLSTTSIRDIVTRLVTEFLPGQSIHPHSFRAMFICLARDQLRDDKAIMNATGIATTATLNYYDIRCLLTTNAINFFAQKMV